ncbi:hypothetical protein AAFF_G00398220, partial [Aldrovandia affinis]
HPPDEQAATASEGDWVFGPSPANNRLKSNPTCVTHSMNEMSELTECPRLVEMTYISA